MSTNQTSQEHIAFYNLKRLPAQLSQAFFFKKKKIQLITLVPGTLFKLKLLVLNIPTGFLVS